jgi:hypothetical protein
MEINRTQGANGEAVSMAISKPSTDPNARMMRWVRQGRVDFYLVWNPLDGGLEFIFANLAKLESFATNSSKDPLVTLDLNPPPKRGAQLKIKLHIHESNVCHQCHGKVKAHDDQTHVVLSEIPQELITPT